MSRQRLLYFTAASLCTLPMRGLHKFQCSFANPRRKSLRFPLPFRDKPSPMPISRLKRGKKGIKKKKSETKRNRMDPIFLSLFSIGKSTVMHIPRRMDHFSNHFDRNFGREKNPQFFEPSLIDRVPNSSRGRRGRKNT